MEKEQRIRDPVHNLIKFSPSDDADRLAWDLIQTPAVQRLRRIRQLGFSEFVFPGASHTRFSHALGAMQMARRMLSVLERNQVFRDSPEHKRMRRATTAAALLHDVGHGPFSHVFEDVAKSLNLSVKHEDYTRRIIRAAPVSRILKKYGVLEETAQFFETEQPNMYSAIISSQLDADRLDFLCRDRHFTGIQFGEIDLEWLFDSLRIEEVPFDFDTTSRRPTFVVIEKGLHVVEEYITSYLNLYQSVYLHKTTRGVQILAKRVLELALANKAGLKRGGLSNNLVDFLSAKRRPSLKLFLKLDDTDVVTFIKNVSRSNLGEATRLAKRFLDRQPLRCVDLTESDGSLNTSKIGAFFERLKDKKVWYIRDIVSPKGFKQYELLDENFLNNLMVKTYRSRHVPIGSLRPFLIRHTPRSCRVYFASERERQRAKNIWQKL